MTHPQLVLLFPGQGAYAPGALRAAGARHGEVGAVLAEVDQVARAWAGAPVSDLLLSPDAPPLGELLATAPDLAQLAIYAASVAHAAVLDARGLAPDVHVGHSLGEIAALVTAGAFTVRDGAEVIRHRQEALRARGTAGRMAAVGLPARAAEALVTLVGSDRLAVAVENGETQAVLSGTDAGIAAAGEVARATGTSFAVLDAPSPFHNPLLAPAAAELAVRLRGLTQQPLRRAVHSPIAGRAYTDEDVLSDHLAAHLVQRVRFSTLVERLALASPTWVEVGAGGTLARLVRRAVPSATAIPGLDGADATLDATLAVAGAAPVVATSVAPVPTPVLAPVAVPAGNGAAPGREEVAARLRSLYAEALEYPEEVFTDDVALERDLGIDSVKQTELLGRGAELYGLPAQPSDFRLSDYDTMGKVVDYVLAHAEPIPSESPAEVAAESPAPAAALDREGVAARLRSLYAEALEYPEEVFTDDVALERDLGIDSVKQTELLGRGAELYGLPAQPSDFRLSDYDTMGKVVDYVLAHAGSPTGERAPLSVVPAAAGNAGSGDGDVDGLEAWRRSA